MPPREATLKSMEEITGALIGIGLVLTAVFLPMAFFGGSTGVIYRQFSVTIVSAMVAVDPGGAGAVARRSAPPCSSRCEGEGHVKHGRFFGWFNRNFDAFRDWYHDAHRAGVLQHAWRTMMAFAGDRGGAGAAVRPPAHRLPARRGPGLHLQPDHPARRRHPARTLEVAQAGGATITWTTKRTMSTSSSPSPASPSPARARIPAWPSPI